MKNITLFLSALVALLFSVAETSAQITPPYYNPANVRITGGTINGTTVGATTAAAGSFTNVKASQSLRSENSGVPPGSSGPGLEIVGGATSYLQAYNRTTSAYSPLVLLGSLVTVGNPLSVTDTTDSSSTTTGALRTAGGLGVAKKAYFGDSIETANQMRSTSTGAAIVATTPSDATTYMAITIQSATPTTYGAGSDADASNTTFSGSLTNHPHVIRVNNSAAATFNTTGITVADGKTFQVGSGSTTSAGLIAGYLGTSGYGAIWSTGVTPSTTNYSFTSNAASTALNASTNINLSIANSPIVTVTGTQAKAFGGSLVRTNPTNYVSGTGTAGVDNTAQDVVTIALAAGTLSQVGDRIRVRVYWTGDTGTAITGTLKINGVTIADTTDSGAASLQVSEAWLHYIDNTHANIIENENGALGNNSAVNVAGFSWNTSQNIVISQNAIANNHIVVYFLAADIFPK